MAGKSLSTPLIFVALSAAILGISAWALLGGPEASTPTAPAQPRLAQADVRVDRQDTARRPAFSDDETPASSPMSVSNPEPAAAERVPLDRPASLSDETKAQQDAYAALQKRVQDEVSGQLRRQRSALASACSALAADAGDVEFTVSASFDADGRLVDSGIAVPAGGAQVRELGQCLRGQTLTLQATAPGQGVSVDLPLSLR